MSIVDLTRNAVHVHPEGALEQKLALGRPLRVKLGIDPTGPDIHIGFAVVLRRLAAFQREGHIAVLIVGDYTARIGDPSGRSQERQILADEVLDRNAELFAEQAYRILDRERTEVRFNGEWLGKLDYAELVRLTRTGTVAQLLERDDFAQRFRGREPISVSELLYPFAQGYDSVAVQADVEVGGTDQLYNLLMGRDVMANYGLEPQAVITYELLVGTDGVEKMSKSQGNYVGIDEPPEEQFGKVMSIPDAALDQWWRLCLDAEPPRLEPMKSKLALARGIVDLYNGPEAAGRAEAHFTRVVREGQAPEDVPEAGLPPGDPVHLPAVLADCFGLSTSEARRLIAQGGVKVDGEVVDEVDIHRARLVGALVQAGKRRFVRFTS
ncbi:MAG: tyrosine--tRNA ligase [Actinobacteria bacterium RBG_16_68_12]|nr:MAG: tyrosine--tRNA ligase [Actinobacteria bacterium RBG_16_68_12]